jgi:hypothetical protein
MLRARLIGGLAVFGAAAVLAAPAGAAPSGTASPGNYPSEAYGDSSTVGDTYPTVIVLLQPVNPAAVENGVLGAKKTVSRHPLAVTAQRGTLPFTGLPVSLLALVGGVLLGSGLLLRASARSVT